jgi:hypothetical protein
MKSWFFISRERKPSVLKTMLTDTGNTIRGETRKSREGFSKALRNLGKGIRGAPRDLVNLSVDFGKGYIYEQVFFDLRPYHREINKRLNLDDCMSNSPVGSIPGLFAGATQDALTTFGTIFYVAGHDSWYTAPATAIT